MKKKILIGALVVIVIIAIVALLIKSCEKTDPLSAINEKNAFINANIELNCIILAEPEIANNITKLESTLTEIYQKHGLPINDNKTMLYILEKYEFDPETTAIIKNLSEKCENGQPTELYEGPVAPRESAK